MGGTANLRNVDEKRRLKMRSRKLGREMGGINVDMVREATRPRRNKKRTRVDGRKGKKKAVVGKDVQGQEREERKGR